LVQDLCDGAVWLDHGHVKAVGDSRDVVQQYVDSVNSREAAANESHTTESSLSGHPRLGSGEVRIDRVEYFDDRGASSSVVVAGEPATFRLHYSAREPMSEVVFGLGFVHESGVTVAGPNSGASGRSVPPIVRQGSIDFRVPQLALQPGVYQVSAAAVSKGHTYDYVDRAYELRVRGATTEPGLTRMFGEWTYDGLPVGAPGLTEATNA
jgi:ABC-2 type transport system ATP-binding protein/lipopolysaccharide transport system ATP-binding protein